MSSCIVPPFYSLFRSQPTYEELKPLHNLIAHAAAEEFAAYL